MYRRLIATQLSAPFMRKQNQEARLIVSAFLALPLPCPRTRGLVPLADGCHRLCGLRAFMLAVNRAILGEQLGDADNLRTEH